MQSHNIVALLRVFKMYRYAQMSDRPDSSTLRAAKKKCVSKQVKSAIAIDAPTFSGARSNGLRKQSP